MNNQKNKKFKIGVDKQPNSLYNKNQKETNKS